MFIYRSIYTYKYRYMGCVRVLSVYEFVHCACASVGTCE